MAFTASRNFSVTCPRHGRRRNRLAQLFPNESDQPTRSRQRADVAVQVQPVQAFHFQGHMPVQQFRYARHHAAASRPRTALVLQAADASVSATRENILISLHPCCKWLDARFAEMLRSRRYASAERRPRRKTCLRSTGARAILRCRRPALIANSICAPMLTSLATTA